MTVHDDLATPRSPLDEVIAEVEHNAKQSDPFLAVVLDDAALYLRRLAAAEDVLALVEVARAARAFYDDEPVNGVEAVEALRAALARLDKEQP